VLRLDFEACDEAVVDAAVDQTWSFFNELNLGRPPESTRRRRSPGRRAPRWAWRLGVNGGDDGGVRGGGGGVGGSESVAQGRTPQP
jgi:hypothetical protein